MRRLVFLLIASVAWMQAAVAGEPVRIAILEFESKGGISPAQMDALADMLANEIRSRGNFKVIGKSDIRSTINLAERKMQLGCNDDSCFAELGGALGVKWLVVGNISLFGSTYLMNLKLLDVEAVEVAWSASERITGGEEKLLDALSKAAAAMVQKVFLKGEPAEGEQKPTGAGKERAESGAAEKSKTESAVQARKEKPAPDRMAASAPAQKPVPVVIVGKQKTVTSPVATWGKVFTYVGGAGVLFGAAATVLSWYEARTYNDTTADPAARVSARDSSRMWGQLMWIGYGVGGGLTVAGLLMQWLAPEERVVTIGAAPLPQGGVVAVGWSW